MHCHLLLCASDFCAWLSQHFLQCDDISRIPLWVGTRTRSLENYVLKPFTDQMNTWFIVKIIERLIHKENNPHNIDNNWCLNTLFYWLTVQKSDGAILSLQHIFAIFKLILIPRAIILVMALYTLWHLDCKRFVLIYFNTIIQWSVRHISWRVSISVYIVVLYRTLMHKLYIFLPTLSSFLYLFNFSL